MMTEYEDTDGPALSPKQREYLETLKTTLETTIEACQEPLDAKVLALIEIAHDIVDQQLKLDLFHEWGPAMELDQAVANKPDGQQFLFLDNDTTPKETETPSAEDLEQWFGV